MTEKKSFEKNRMSRKWAKARTTLRKMLVMLTEV